MLSKDLSRDYSPIFNVLFNELNELVSISDVNGNMIDSNQAWKKTFCSAKEVGISLIFDIVHDDDKQLLKDSINNLVHNKKLKINILCRLNNFSYQKFEWKLVKEDAHFFIIAKASITENIVNENNDAYTITTVDNNGAILLSKRIDTQNLFRNLLNKSLTTELNKILAELKSSKGYLYIIDKETEVFHLHAYSDSIHTVETHEEVIQSFQRDQLGLLGETVRTEKSLIRNDIVSPFSQPTQHIELDNKLINCITIPVIQSESVIALFVFINDKRLFDTSDLKYALEKLEHSCENIELQRSYTELVKNQERAQIAEEQASIGYFEHNLITGKNWWSNNMYKLLGFDPANGIPSDGDYLEHIYPEDRATLGEIMNRIPAGQELFNFEFRTDPKFTPFRYFSPVLDTQYDCSGKPVSVSGTLIDITKKKMAQQALRSSEVRALALLNAIPDMIFRFTEDGNFIDFIADEKNLFIEPELFVGKNYVEVLPANISEIIKVNLEKTLATKELQCFEYELSNKKIGNRTFEARMVSSGSDEIIVIVRDITERKNAEKELQQKEESLSLTLQSIGEAVIVTDTKGRITRMNKVAEKLTGWEFNEANLKHIEKVFSIVNAQTKDKQYSPVLSVLESKSIVTLANDTILISKTGVEYNITESAAPILDEEGNMLGTIMVFSDVSEKYLSNSLILEQERRLSTLMYNLPGMVYRCKNDENYTMEFVSEHALKLTGYTCQELISGIEISYGDLIDPEHKEKMRKAVKKDIDEKTTFQTEYRITTKDGDQKWVWEQGTGIISKNGEIVAIEGIIEDITMRKYYENELEKSKSRYRELFVNNPVPMFIFNVETLEIVEVNDAAVNNYGYTRDEFSHMTIKEIRPKEDIRLVMSIIDDYKQSMVTVHNWRHLKKDGTVFNVRVVSHRLPEVDGIKLQMVIATDITDRVIAEARLNEAKLKAEESNHLKTAFLANMSHEIRTPMTGILGFTDLLKDPKLDKQTQLEYISVIEQSGQRMLHIINDIIDISKIEAGKMDLKMEDIELNGLMTHLYMFFKPEAENKGLKLFFIKNYDDEYTIETDKTKLTQVLTNLIKNAIKFTSKGEIAFGFQNSDGILQFYVKDTGIGIPQDQQEKIFERYSQGKIESSLSKLGVGLGLAITKAFISMLGGRIWVESSVGKGSAFNFEIPYHQPSVISDVKISQLNIGNGLNNKQLLIVDDDINSQLFMKYLFDFYHLKYILADNGQDAVDIVKENPQIDLIFMDVMMPIMDGFEATRRIKAINKNIPVIALTAFALSGDNSKAIDAGCDDYIAKPVKKEQIYELINKYLK